MNRKNKKTTKRTAYKDLYKTTKQGEQNTGEKSDKLQTDDIFTKDSTEPYSPKEAAMRYFFSTDNIEPFNELWDDETDEIWVL